VYIDIVKILQISDKHL